MKIVGSDFDMLDGLGNGRARGFAELRRIVNAIRPVSKRMNSAALFEGLAASCYYLSTTHSCAYSLESVTRAAEDYAIGRRDVLQEASEVALAIATIADSLKTDDILGMFIEIVRRLDR